MRRLSTTHWIAACVLLLWSGTGQGAEISVGLTGDLEYPGLFTLKGEGQEAGRLCFLSEEAHGYLDPEFLGTLSAGGIPEGAYRVSPALPEEQWPVGEFVKFGALRLLPETEAAAQQLAALDKKGIAVHGRDFYPLAVRVTDNSKMVRFVSDRLFEQLSGRWGALRISNWDMGRLYDFYSKTSAARESWNVRVVRAELATVRNICEPLKVQRRLGMPPE